MSKTDKTRPYWVRRAEHGESVDTIPGSCCYGCGCPVCADTAGRKRRTRRERYAGRREARSRTD